VRSGIPSDFPLVVPPREHRTVAIDNDRTNGNVIVRERSPRLFKRNIHQFVMIETHFFLTTDHSARRGVALPPRNHRATEQVASEGAHGGGLPPPW